MTLKELSVTAIKHGTVIDHIPGGKALRIIELLRLHEKNLQVTAGMHLRSQKHKVKDIIKIEGMHLSEAEIDNIAVFAPDATVNIIENFAVKEKHRAELPDRIFGILRCPNPRCISAVEATQSRFQVERSRGDIFLVCYFCEKNFTREEFSK